MLSDAKKLFYLSLPIILSNILSSVYQLIDLFWIGKLGADAIASLSISISLFLFFTFFGIGLLSSLTIISSQYFGKNNKKGLIKLTSNSLIVAIVLSLLLIIVGYIVIPLILPAFNLTDSVQKGALEYINISLIGILPLFIYLSFESIYRGMGNTKTPFYIILLSVILNFVLDPIFINGFYNFQGLGISGAALATVITQTISAILALYILRKNGLLTKLTMDKKMLKKILTLGLPMSISRSSSSFSFNIINYFVAKYGTLAIASFGLALRVNAMLLIPLFGLSMGNSIIVGQYVGANKKNIKSTVINLTKFYLIFVLGIFFLLHLFSNNLFLLFTDDQKVISLSSSIFSILIINLILLYLLDMIFGYFRGLGNTRLVMFLTIFQHWILRIPLVFILSSYFKLMGIVYAFPISVLILLIISIYLFYKKY